MLTFFFVQVVHNSVNSFLSSLLHFPVQVSSTFYWIIAFFSKQLLTVSTIESLSVKRDLIWMTWPSHSLLGKAMLLLVFKFLI